jgi:hypothetical protein
MPSGKRDDELGKLIEVVERWLDQITDFVNDEAIGAALSEIQDFRRYLIKQLEAVADIMSELENSNEVLGEVIKKLENYIKKQAI